MNVRNTLILALINDPNRQFASVQSILSDVNTLAPVVEGLIRETRVQTPQDFTGLNTADRNTLHRLNGYGNWSDLVDAEKDAILRILSLIPNVTRLVRENKKIAAIKELRTVAELPGSGSLTLKFCKDVIDAYSCTLGPA